LGIYSTEQHLRQPYHYFKGNDFLELELANENEDKTLLGMNWRLLTGVKGFLNTSVFYSRVKQNQTEGQIYIDPIYNRKLFENETSVRYPVYQCGIDETQSGIKTDFTYNFSNMLNFSAGFSFQKMQSNSGINLNGLDTVYVFKSGENIPGQNFLVISPEDLNCKFDNSRNEYSSYIETSFSPKQEININTGLRLNTTILTIIF